MNILHAEETMHRSRKSTVFGCRSPVGTRGESLRFFWGTGKFSAFQGSYLPGKVGASTALTAPYFQRHSILFACRNTQINRISEY